MSLGSLVIRGARVVPLDQSPDLRAGSRAAAAPPAARRRAGTAEPVDLVIRDGVIVSRRPAGRAGRPAAADEAGLPVLDVDGAWVVPGLWDAHVHVGQWLRREAWHDVTGSPDAAAVCARVREVVGSLAPDDDRFLMFFGSRSSTWPRPAAVADLDAVSGRHPVVVVAGDVHNGWLNSAALAALGVPPRPDPIAEGPWFAVLPRLTALPQVTPSADDERRALQRLAALGLTGLVDLEWADTLSDWPRRVRAGADALRVRAGFYEPQLEEILHAGLRSGDQVPGGEGLVTLGPLKIISDGSLGTRTAWCDEPYAGLVDDQGRPSPPDHGSPNLSGAELRELLARATAADLDVAVHAIGDAANHQALSAFEATGARGGIEHAQLLRRDDIPLFARLGVVASVQPLHLIDDRDATERLWPGRADRVFPFRSLLDAGATVHFGSDAPVSPVDPWGAMAAAVHRSGDERPAWHPEQQVSPAEALSCSVDGRRLTPGSSGDAVVLGGDPLAPAGSAAAAAAGLRGMEVLATVCAGRITFERARADGSP